MLSAVFIGVIVCAYAFEFINGFHDTANAIATSVYTRALETNKAIILAAWVVTLPVALVLGGLFLPLRSVSLCNAASEEGAKKERQTAVSAAVFSWKRAGRLHGIAIFVRRRRGRRTCRKREGRV